MFINFRSRQVNIFMNENSNNPTEDNNVNEEKTLTKENAAAPRTRVAVDLGKGSVHRLLLKLAVPTVISQLVNLLYNIVDRVYIGHIPFEGVQALTGLGLCMPILMIVTACSSLIGTGGAPRAAIFMGRGDNTQAEHILGNCFKMLIILALLLTVGVEAFAVPLLKLFGASSDTLPYALSYLRIYAVGTICVMISLGLNSFITTQGATSVSMKTVLIGAVINIILDPILIFGFDMGVSGAALATIISQFVSAIWVLKYLTGSKTQLKLKLSNTKLDKAIVLPVLALGVAPFIMSSTESILNIAFNASLSRYGGDIAVGSMTILSSVMQLQMLPVQGLAQGAQPLMSYNFGAGKPDRVKSAFKALLVTSLGYTLIFWAAVQLFPGVFVAIFNSSSEELMQAASRALRIYMGTSGLFGIQMAVQMFFTSLGEAKLSLFVAILRKIILLIPLILILPIFMSDKVTAVFLAEPIADLISVVVCTMLFAVNIRNILNKARR